MAFCWPVSGFPLLLSIVFVIPIGYFRSSAAHDERVLAHDLGVRGHSHYHVDRGHGRRSHQMQPVLARGQHGDGLWGVHCRGIQRVQVHQLHATRIQTLQQTHQSEARTSNYVIANQTVL